MREGKYQSVIRDMTWSYSRVQAFESCPYRWFLKYIREEKTGPTFFASFGSFLHKLIDRYYSEGRKPDQLVTDYLTGFRREVEGSSPNSKIYSNWFQSGLRYLRSIQPLPFSVLETELKAEFPVYGVPMMGFIDYVGTDGDDLVIVDHKSRDLKPRSNRKKPTKQDEELDDYLRQLYLYSAAVEQKYGRLPKLLCFNCFRTGTLIREQFDEEKFIEAKQWLKRRTEAIAEEEEFRPNMDWFQCRYLCECRDECEYFEMNRR